MKLKDPEECPSCRARRFRVIASKRRAGYRRKILRCKECGQQWPAYFSLIDPRAAWQCMTDDERARYAKKTA